MFCATGGRKMRSATEGSEGLEATVGLQWRAIKGPKTGVKLADRIPAFDQSSDRFLSLKAESKPVNRGST